MQSEDGDFGELSWRCEKDAELLFDDETEWRMKGKCEERRRGGEDLLQVDGSIELHCAEIQMLKLSQHWRSVWWG